jgi:YVTN family beta-propeller protein
MLAGSKWMEFAMLRLEMDQFLFRTVCGALLIAGVAAVPAHVAAQQPYHVIDRWQIGGEGGWDYLLVDSAAHRLYVTHGPRVEVLDTKTGKSVGAISGLHGTHGVTLDSAGKYGYISDGGGNAVVVFDRASLATVATIPAGSNPDGIVFEPSTQTVWAFNGRSKDATVIDAASQKVVATIALPGKPEFPVVDGKGVVYVNIEDKNEIVRLDAREKKMTADWPIGCESPSGMAFDVAGHRLFPVCDGKKMPVVDSETGKVLAAAGIGDGPDAARWSASKHLVFASSGGDGMLSVVDASAKGFPTIEKLPTQRGARTMEYDPESDRIYTVTAEFGPPTAPTAQNPRPRASVVPGSFRVIVIGR